MKKCTLLILVCFSFGLKGYSWKVNNSTNEPLHVHIDTSLAGAHHKAKDYSGKPGEMHTFHWGGIHAGACFKQFKIYKAKGDDKHDKKVATIKRTSLKDARGKRSEWTGCKDALLTIHKRGGKYYAVAQYGGTNV